MEESKNTVQMPQNDITDDIKQLLTCLKEEKQRMDYIKPEMLPEIDLYMDQVTTFMDAHLQSTKRYTDDKILTKTMINNYAKNNLLPPPEKKKYSKDHMLLLTFIYYFKNMLSMNDIQCLLAPIKENYFGTSHTGLSMEDVYQEIFSTEQSIQSGIIDDILSKFDLSRESFKDFVPQEEDAAADPGQKNRLQDFTFICMLCYDIFLKKQLVEKIVDCMTKRNEPADEKKKHK